MNRRKLLATVGVAGVAGVAGCGDAGEQTETSEPTDAATDASETETTAEPTETSEPTATETDPPEAEVDWSYRVGPDGFERSRDGGPFEPMTVRGVNLGIAKPGFFPGQSAITREEYDRWIAYMGEIGNAVRIYTIHPPEFYRALAAYNVEAEEPLLLFHGTWLPIQELHESGDATTISETVDTEIRETVDVVHGATTLPDKPGYSSGTFDADVSEWTLGYMFGVEWPPKEVVSTNEANADRRDEEYRGTYLRTEDGSPFEQWLAERVDKQIDYEQTEYGETRPAGFVNWVTTDPLEHPYEPFENEDLVSVDPDSVVATDAYDPGTYAAYHVYPYYPDLLNTTPEYTEYVDHRGETNSYAGYLNDLVGSTDHPVLIAEFGVPSSRGIAHRDVDGRDQGRHTETEQGEMIVGMYEDILHQDTAGGLAFAWHDEWFKRTWNLDARTIPNRRAFWSNIETPEQRFGLMAFEDPNAVSLDGTESDWEDAKTVVPETPSGGTRPGPRKITALDVSHDVEGLTFRVEFDALSDPVDWSAGNVLLTIGLTGRDNELPFETDAQAQADYVVRLAGPDDSRMLVDCQYDAFAREFWWGPEDLEVADYRDGSAGFVPVREPINLGYQIPATKEWVPFNAVETGELRYGNGNPEADDYDSLTDVHVDPAGDAIELRLPWLLLNVSDPSSKQRIATAWEDKLEKVDFENVSVAAATYRPQSDGSARQLDGETNLYHAAPGLDGDRLQTATYTWEPWDRPDYEERLKPSYHIVEEAWSDLE